MPRPRTVLHSMRIASGASSVAEAFRRRSQRTCTGRARRRQGRRFLKALSRKHLGVCPGRSGWVVSGPCSTDMAPLAGLESEVSFGTGGKSGGFGGFRAGSDLDVGDASDALGDGSSTGIRRVSDACSTGVERGSDGSKWLGFRVRTVLGSTQHVFTTDTETQRRNADSDFKEQAVRSSCALFFLRGDRVSLFSENRSSHRLGEFTNVGRQMSIRIGLRGAIVSGGQLRSECQ
jgi:hypothetical protein